ncbi:MAG: metallopeptidase family protein [Alphaproteobacteria bacterium]|nr:metallopeptidase family protein [Alphaproteobacteria bacterium]
MQFTTPPDPDTIATLAERALNAIPARLRDHITNLAIAVEEEADDDTIAEMGFETPWELTGLYRGTPLGERSVSDIARAPDLIILYRLPILLEWIEEGEDLYRLVRNVVIHEVAHHFGFSDAEIAALEAEIGD